MEPLLKSNLKNDENEDAEYIGIETIAELDPESQQAKELFKNSFLIIGGKYFVTLRLFWKCFYKEKSWNTFRFDIYQKINSKKFEYLVVKVEVGKKKFILIELPDPENKEFKIHLLGLERKCGRSITLYVKMPKFLSKYLFLIEKPIVCPEYFDFYKFVRERDLDFLYGKIFTDNEETKVSIVIFRNEYEILMEASKRYKFGIQSIVSCYFWAYLNEKHPDIAEEIQKKLNSEVQYGDMLPSLEYVGGGCQESLQRT